MSTTQQHPAGSAAGDAPVAASARGEWVTVSAPVAASGAERPISTRRVLIRVIAGVAIVLLLVGVSGSVASRKVAEKQSVNDAAKTANVLAEVVVQPALTDGLLSGDPGALAAMDEAVREHVLGTSSVRVKIWTPAGRIIYSDEPALIGQTFELGAEERGVFTKPMTRAEVSDLDRPENRFELGGGRLLEVYRPVWTPNGKPLLFETYAPYDDVTARAGQMWRGFAGIALSSLFALIALLLPILWRLLDRVRRSQAQREALLQRAVDASTDERRRIAGTLHDGVVQELAATSFVVSSAAERADAIGQPGLAADLREATGTVRASIGGLRSLLVDIYPPNLATSGLGAALGDLAATMRLRDIDVSLEVSLSDRSALDEADERLLYRVAQECLLNTVRHAQARTAWIRLRGDQGYVVLDVRDDGVGFDAADVLAHPPEGHFGLRVLGDVAADAGAELSVASRLGEGTQWKLTIPAR